MRPTPIAVTTDGAVASAALLWRFQRRLHLTVVVKAEFSIVHGNEATYAGPGELVADDAPRASSDLVPYRQRCDVTFVGHAFAPEGRPAPASAVRLGLAREALLLDKSLHVFGDGSGPRRDSFTRMPLVYERALGGAGQANPVGTSWPNVVDPRDASKAGGFGPIARAWPPRAGRLTPTQLSALEAIVPELPDAMTWEYFQAAPPDQQVDYLLGGEWLVLDGLHPQLARVQTRLPAASAFARVTAAKEAALRLVCDTLTIDGDRQVLSMVWRGHQEIAGAENAVAGVRIAAGLVGVVAPGKASAKPGKPPAMGTLSLDIGEQQRAAAKPIAPFPVAPAGPPAMQSRPTPAPWHSRGPKPPAPPEDLMGTLPLDEVLISPLAERRAPPVQEFVAARTEPPPPRDAGATALEAKLRAAGAGSDDLAALLGALKPMKRP